MIFDHRIHLKLFSKMMKIFSVFLKIIKMLVHFIIYHLPQLILVQHLQINPM
jgi:hypothetical protein